MDFAQSVRLAVDSGKVELGLDKALKLSVIGGAKLVVIAKNCPKAVELRDYCVSSKIPFVDYKGNGVDLGAVCGKPFSVSALAVVEAGNSDVLNVAKSSK